MTRIKRALSLIMSAAMMTSSFGAAISAYAEEVQTEVITEKETDTATEKMQEIEGYALILPYHEECSYTFDENKQIQQQGDQKEIVLWYVPDEKVEISLIKRDGWEIDTIHLSDDQKQKYSFDWSEECKVMFQMPSRNLTLDITFAEIVSEPESENITEISTEEDILETEIQDVSESEVVKSEEMSEALQAETEDLLLESEKDTERGCGHFLGPFTNQCPRRIKLL